ncbi:hypothetical protein LEP1GSC168_3345 [Leptospira santarosai str. HAI134]|nr:hypothetical protein LEP1GSC168_3345 [Leptospira santarosai str. HAI134]
MQLNNALIYFHFQKPISYRNYLTVFKISPVYWQIRFVYSYSTFDLQDFTFPNIYHWKYLD